MFFLYIYNYERLCNEAVKPEFTFGFDSSIPNLRKENDQPSKLHRTSVIRITKRQNTAFLTCIL